MTWRTRFRIRQYLKGSIWVVPFIGGVLGTVLGVLEPRLDEAISVPEAWQYSPSTADAVLAAIIGAMAALTLERLAVTVKVSFGDSVDFDRAATPDRQGIGGPTASARLEQERFLAVSRPAQAFGAAPPIPRPERADARRRR